MDVRVVLLVASYAAASLSMESPEPPCPSRNSCQNRKATDPPDKRSSCHCDPFCNTYADCCLDAKYRDPSRQKIDYHNEFWCKTLGGEAFPSYVKPPRCKEGWADKEVEDMCLSFDMVTDPLSSLLVTSRTTGITYRNYYCAICNKDALELRMWNGKLSCDLPHDAEFNLTDLVFKFNTWGVFYGSPEEGDFRKCYLEPERPKDIKNLTRNCFPFIKTCRKDWQDKVVAAQCQSYTGVVYHGEERYRNPHCALCNNKIGNYSCDDPEDYYKGHDVSDGHYYEGHDVSDGHHNEGHDVSDGHYDEGHDVSDGHYYKDDDVRDDYYYEDDDVNPVARSFARTLELSGPAYNIVGSSTPCTPSQVWEPFSESCRNIACAAPRIYMYGKCQDVSDDNLTSSEQTTPSTTPASPASVSSKLTTLSPACPSRNSCQRRKDCTGQPPFSCYCDASCNLYSDCCLDAEHRDASRQKKHKYNEFWCERFGDETFNSYVKRPRCKEGWADEEVEKLCFNATMKINPLGTLLATSRSTGITYYNYHCAICNEDVLDLRMWNAKLSCDLPEDAEVHLKDLLFVDDELGVFVGNPEEENFRRCYITPERPQDIKHLKRSCPRPHMIETCPDGWQDEEVASLCQSYIAEVYYEGKKRYRNPHCALCNNEKGYYSCLPVHLGNAFIMLGSPPTERFPAMPYTEMLDFTFPSKNLVSSSAPCSPTQIWDPFFKRCRSIMCPKPHQTYRHGRCEDVGDDGAVTPFKMASPLPACPSLNLCGLRSSSHPLYSCHCDALCNTFADCCLNAPNRDADKQKADEHNEFLCEKVDNGFRKYIKARICKEGWTGTVQEYMCVSNETNSLSKHLVTSKTTGITYPNYYCAICNEDVQDLRMWERELDCILPEDEGDQNDIVFNNGEWGYFHGGPEEGRFIPCKTELRVSQDIANLTRSCVTDTIIKTCHDDWQDEAVASLCRSYSAPVHYLQNQSYLSNCKIGDPPEGYSWKEYRNPHCALCNYEMDDYICLPMSFVCVLGPAKPPPGFRPISFSLIFDFTDPSNNQVGSSSPCGLKEFWDPFFKRCRSIVCPKPHQDYRYDKCEDVQDLNSATSDKEATAHNLPASLASLKPACPSRHSCQRRNASDSTIDPPFSCQCDASCNTFADCCLDAEYRDDAKQKIDENYEFLCSTFVSETYPSYVKVPGCKEGWTNEEVEDLCLSNGKDSDPLSSLFVTSKTTGFTYLNYYCAICNEDVRDLRMWNGKLSCDLPVDTEVNLNNLVVNNVRPQSKGLLYWHSTGKESYSCHMSPERPEDVKQLTRHCSSPSMIKTCQSGWKNETLASLCQSYTAVVYGISGKIYRNPHCARCNYEEDYSCVSISHRQTSQRDLFSPPLDAESHLNSYTQILDFTAFSSDKEGSEAPCSVTQVWDPFIKHCRSIVCPKPHQNYRHGRCDNAAHFESVRSTVSSRRNNSNDRTINTRRFNETFPQEKIPDMAPFTGNPEEAAVTPTHLTDDNASSTRAASGHSPAAPPPHFSDRDSSSANFTSEFMECNKTILDEGEFVLLDNGSVYVDPYDRSYSPGEYAVLGEGSLLLCKPDAGSFTPKFSAVLGWVSMVGLGLSCVALLLHLTVFILLPELRNLSGKNLASLCLALLAAYVTFLVNTLVRPGPAMCRTLAATMYYFFVTSFTWMNVIAFDVCYTFRLTHRQLMVSKGAQWPRFIAYSLYGWLLPAAATLALLLVDQLEPHGVPEDLLPRLGRTWCWFSHRKALLAFFAAPIVVIIVLNCGLFVCTAYIIRQAGNTAAGVSARGGYHEGQYKVYLRLSVLMGFTWVSGIAAGYLSLEGLWYVFVLLNTLQGVFIFLAFTVRTRVWRGVGAATRKMLQRSLSRVIGRLPPPDERAVELSDTSSPATSQVTSSTALDD